MGSQSPYDEGVINAIGAYIFIICLLAVVRHRPSMARFEERLDESSPVLMFGLLGGAVYLVAYKFGMWSGESASSSWPVFIFAGLNLWMHEAGHFFFAWGPPLLHSLGGTVLELGVPAGLGLFAFMRGLPRSRGLFLLWCAFNLFGVATYMGDAALRQLPLLGGEGPESHDWWNIFSILGVLPHHEPIAAATAGLGCGAAVLGVLAYVFARRLTREP
jgi:hypothetical protein